MSDESKRQKMVMMGPGFFSSGGSIFGPMIALAIGGWIVALIVGLLWWIFG
jgi:hypothetical protein